jgi:hypothetical protein
LYDSGVPNPLITLRLPPDVAAMWMAAARDRGLTRTALIRQRMAAVEEAVVLDDARPAVATDTGPLVAVPDPPVPVRSIASAPSAVPKRPHHIRCQCSICAGGAA